MLFQIILLTIIIPTTQKHARSLFKSSNVDYFEGLIKPKKFNDTIKDLTIYAEEKNDKGEWYIKGWISGDKIPDNFPHTQI